MKRILASLVVLSLFASPVLAQTADPYSGNTGTTGTTTNPNTGTTGTTGTDPNAGTTNPNTGTTTDMNEVDRTTGTPGEKGVGTGSGEPMQYGDQPNNTGVAASGDGSLPATASPLPLIALIGVGSIMFGLMATRRNRSRR